HDSRVSRRLAELKGPGRAWGLRAPAGLEIKDRVGRKPRLRASRPTVIQIDRGTPMQSFPMLIDGRMVNTTEQDPVINPAFGEPFSTCARATRAHVDEAIAAAERAFKGWRKDEALRRQKLNECAATLQAKAAEIAPFLSQEQGKPLQQATVEIF